MSITDKWNYLIETTNSIKDELQENVLRNCVDKIRTLKAGSNPTTPSDEWQPEPDWWDIETILENDTEEYTQKAIFLLADFLDDNATSNTIKGFTHYKLSDGQEISQTATTTLDISNLFDLSKDKECNKGYKTRYIIAYSNSDEVLSITAPNNVIYCIFDGTILKPASLFTSKKFLQAVIFKDNVYFDGTSFGSMFLGCYSLQKIEGLNTSHGVAFSNTFSSCFSLRKIKLDLSNATSISAIFSGCYNLHEIILLNTENIETFSSSFSNCYKLQRLVDLNISKGASTTTMFSNCTSLIEVLDITAINEDVSFSSSTYLSHSALIRILNALSDLTGQESKTLTLGATNLAKLTDEEKAIATNKNWILK